MVVLRHQVVSKGFGLSRSPAARLRPNRRVAESVSKLLTTRRGDRCEQGSAKAKPCGTLESSNGSKGVRSTSRLQRSVRGILILRIEGSREANQEQRIERSR